MEKEPFIFGKNLTPEDKTEIRGHLERLREMGRQPLEGELEKTAEEVRFIKKINDYIGEEFEEGGLEKAPEISPEQIHLLPAEKFEKNFPDMADTHAFTSASNQAAYIDKAAARGFKTPLYKSILHESIHLSSHFKLQIAEEKPIISRSGFGTANLKHQGDIHFRGLNEGVIDKTVMEIFKKRGKEITDEFNIAPEEAEKLLFFYGEYIDPLNAVIRKIAGKKGESEETVWRRFKKGLFSGEMMHLREVEKTFGKNALKVFAALGSETKNLSKEEVNEKVLKYFETGDEKERQRIGEEILNPKKRRIRMVKIEND